MIRCKTVGITAVGSGIGHAVIESLRLMAHPPRVVGFEAARWCRSHAECDEFLDLPRCSQPGYIDTLLQHCLDRKVEVLIPGSDTELPFLADNRDMFNKHGITLVISSPEVIRVCRDKLSFGRFSSARKLPFAPTWSLEEAIARVDQIPFPVVVKPSDGSGSKGVRVLHTTAELIGFASDEPHVVQPYLVPTHAGGWAANPPCIPRPGQFLPNQDSELIAMQVIAPEGKIIGCMTSINQLRDGVVFLQDPIAAPEVESAARAIAEALIPLGLVGPFNLQGRWTKDGPFFYEPNPRFTGGTQMRSLCGFREVEACLHLFLGGDMDTARALLQPSRSWVALRQTTSIAAPRVIVERKAVPPAQRVLVTGASGFLGNEVVRQLMNRPDLGEIVAMTRDPLRLDRERKERGWTEKVKIVGSSLEADIIGPQPFDGIIHLAALREPDPRDSNELITANLRFTADLVRCAQARGARKFVFCSSQSVYGLGRPPLWRETDPLEPATPYAWTKVAGEELVRQMRNAKLGAVSLRIARLYGFAHGFRWKELPHKLARQAAEGEPLVLHGTGEQSMDLIHVRDAAAAVLAALFARDGGLPESVNIGSGRPIPIRDLFSLYRDAAQELLGREISVRCDASAERPPSFGMDISRAQETLGWAPRQDLRAEVRALVAEAARLKNPEPRP